MSSQKTDQDTVNMEEPKDNQSEEQDGEHEDEEGETKIQTRQELMEEDSSDREQNETRTMEEDKETEGIEGEINNEDMQEGQESRVNKEAVVSAFLQVSEPALVSSHHDGYLRFWNLSVSLVVMCKSHACLQKNNTCVKRSNESILPLIFSDVHFVKGKCQK